MAAEDSAVVLRAAAHTTSSYFSLKLTMSTNKLSCEFSPFHFLSLATSLGCSSYKLKASVADYVSTRIGEMSNVPFRLVCCAHVTKFHMADPPAKLGNTQGSRHVM